MTADLPASGGTSTIFIENLDLGKMTKPPILTFERSWRLVPRRCGIAIRKRHRRQMRAVWALVA